MRCSLFGALIYAVLFEDTHSRASFPSESQTPRHHHSQRHSEQHRQQQSLEADTHDDSTHNVEAIVDSQGDSHDADQHRRKGTNHIKQPGKQALETDSAPSVAAIIDFRGETEHRTAPSPAEPQIRREDPGQQLLETEATQGATKAEHASSLDRLLEDEDEDHEAAHFSEMEAHIISNAFGRKGPTPAPEIPVPQEVWEPYQEPVTKDPNAVKLGWDGQPEELTVNSPRICEKCMTCWGDCVCERLHEFWPGFMKQLPGSIEGQDVNCRCVAYWPTGPGDQKYACAALYNQCKCDARRNWCKEDWVEQPTHTNKWFCPGPVAYFGTTVTPAPIPVVTTLDPGAQAAQAAQNAMNAASSWFR